MAYRSWGDAADFRAHIQITALLLNFMHQSPADLAIVDDGGRRYAKGCDAGNVGLNFPRLFGAEPHDRHAILHGAIEDLIQEGNLLWFRRNNELPANINRDSVFVTESAH